MACALSLYLEFQSPNFNSIYLIFLRDYRIEFLENLWCSGDDQIHFVKHLSPVKPLESNNHLLLEFELVHQFIKADKVILMLWFTEGINEMIEKPLQLYLLLK